MAQAFFTSMGGINAAQSQINVIANNVANINTMGFKSSNMTFEDIYYVTHSSGSAPTKTLGGTNPRQVGLGVQVSAISKNFTPGTTTTTGRNTDINIQGNGFFCVQNGNGAIMYTRAGNFSIDANGVMVDPNGNKVMGTNTIFGSQGSDTPVKIPTLIKTETVPNTKDIMIKDLSKLNGVDIIKGTFTIKADLRPAGGAIDTTATIDISNCDDLNSVVAEINKQLQATGIPSTASVKDGKLVFTNDTTKCNGLKFGSGTSNFTSVTDLAGAQSAADGSYSSQVLDYKQQISMPDVIAEAQGHEDVAIYESGAIEVTYANGDKLRVVLDETTNKNVFRYTTADGIIIEGNDVEMNPDVCKVENLQIQLAKFTNPDGLVQVGSNLFQQSANSGNPYYGFAGVSGLGGLQTGALEASNVDLAEQFANMIQAQRAVEANSRVFSTTNEVLKTLVYMGQ